jgi:hypothetical protein
MRRRTALYAALALLVPASAFALGNGAPGADGQLAVSASLDSCGIYQSAVVCKIDATFDQVDGATSYTASVTRGDGSVIDYGEIDGGGATSFWVPYSGNGTYTVQISAYGQLDADPQLDRVATERFGAGEGDGRSPAGASANDAPAGQDGQTGPGTGDGSDDPSGGGDANPPDDTSCDEQLAPLGDAATQTQDAATFAGQGQFPESIDCPPDDQPPDDGSGDPGTTPPPDGTTTTPVEPPPAP